MASQTCSVWMSAEAGGSAMVHSGNCVSSRRNTRRDMSSTLADIYFELPEPYFIPSSSKRYENIPKDHKRCGICRKIIPLSQFHRISRINPNPRYACISCHHIQNKARYQRKGSSPYRVGNFDGLVTEGAKGRCKRVSPRILVLSF